MFIPDCRVSQRSLVMIVESIDFTFGAVLFIAVQALLAASAEILHVAPADPVASIFSLAKLLS